MNKQTDEDIKENLWCFPTLNCRAKVEIRDEKKVVIQPNPKSIVGEILAIFGTLNSIRINP